MKPFLACVFRPSIFGLLVLLKVKQPNELVAVREHTLIPSSNLLEVVASIPVDAESVQTLVVVCHHFGSL